MLNRIFGTRMDEMKETKQKKKTKKKGKKAEDEGVGWKSAMPLRPP
jgi:hypothetical protein